MKSYKLSIVEKKDGSIIVKQDLNRLNLFIVTGVLEKIRQNWFDKLNDEVRLNVNIKDTDFINTDFIDAEFDEDCAEGCS